MIRGGSALGSRAGGARTATNLRTASTTHSQPMANDGPHAYCYPNLAVRCVKTPRTTSTATRPMPDSHSLRTHLHRVLALRKGPAAVGLNDSQVAGGLR